MELLSVFKNITKSVRRYIRRIDMILFATIVALLVFGTINMYGVVGIDSGMQFWRYVTFAVVGLGVMTIASFFDYRIIRNYSIPSLFIYILLLVLLALTLLFPSVRGTRAWISFGAIGIEPSEFMKLALIFVLAKFFSQRHVLINHFKHTVVSGIYAGIPIILILMQPDLGSAAIVGLVWFGILMAAGIRRRHAFILIALALLIASLGWFVALQPYQKDRLVSFLNPYQDPTGAGYNSIQSRIALGAGSWTGKGLGAGSQTSLGFLPEAHTDFVFASTVEQFGFLGGLAFLVGVAIVLFRILAIGGRAQNNFGKLFCIGLSIFIFSHILVNISGNLGILPITGLPLTFMSIGGSHLISVMLGIGIAQSIKRLS